MNHLMWSCYGRDLRMDFEQEKWLNILKYQSIKVWIFCYYGQLDDFHMHNLFIICIACLFYFYFYFDTMSCDVYARTRKGWGGLLMQCTTSLSFNCSFWRIQWKFKWQINSSRLLQVVLKSSFYVSQQCKQWQTIIKWSFPSLFVVKHKKWKTTFRTIVPFE